MTTNEKDTVLPPTIPARGPPQASPPIKYHPTGPERTLEALLRLLEKARYRIIEELSARQEEKFVSVPILRAVSHVAGICTGAEQRGHSIEIPDTANSHHRKGVSSISLSIFHDCPRLRTVLDDVRARHWLNDHITLLPLTPPKLCERAGFVNMEQAPPASTAKEGSELHAGAPNCPVVSPRNVGPAQSSTRGALATTPNRKPQRTETQPSRPTNALAQDKRTLYY